MTTMEKISLEPTSAMALLLVQEAYQGNAHITQYLQKIDLSSGIPLVERLKSALSHAAEVAENRKYFFHQYILHNVRSNPENSQLVILGVGYDPISILLLDRAADKIELIIEIDMSCFDTKAALFKAIGVPHLEKIKFVQANIITDNTLDIIRLHGYAEDKPAVIALEGLVYYLTEEHFVALVQSLRSPNKKNSFCVDYLLPGTAMPTEQARIEHKRSVEGLEQRLGMKLTSYSREKIVGVLKKLGATSIEVTTQKDVENMRTGRNKCFINGEGVTEFVTFKI